MAIIKCKMCGGDMEISADKTFGTCEYCGNTMTLPKIDDDQRAAAFNRGNHFRRIGEFDKALQVYERIVQEDDTDAEAHWCCALCRFGIEYVEDPTTYEWIPTCHRASFDSFLEDVDYLASVEHSDGITKRQYIRDGAKIADVQRGILATSQNEKPYDVFICYKETDENGQRTRDSAMAQDIYYQLTEQGRRVFFARITLEDMVGKQYEPYIFAALNSAKVMIVVGTKPEHLNAVWVKNEWSRFLAMMRHDRNKILLPCYRDMDPYDLPEQLSVLQSYDMAKIGFIQDLTRGISKVLDADKQRDSVQETVVVQQSGGRGAEVAVLLKRVFIFLEDGDWKSANDYCEKVLDMDPECAEAYLGKVLAGTHHAKLDQISIDILRLQENKDFKKVLHFGSDDLKKKLDNMRIVAERAREENKKQLLANRKKIQPAENLISTGESHTAVICTDGTAVAVGDNEFGQCNVSKWHDIVAISAGRCHTVGLRSDGTVVAVGDDGYGQCNVYGWRDIVAISGGNYNTVGLRSDGTVVAVGDNKFGQCNVRGWKLFNDIETLKEEQAAERKDSERKAWWRSQGLCQYCGGELKGFFSKKCVNCGNAKDY